MDELVTEVVEDPGVMAPRAAFDFSRDGQRFPMLTPVKPREPIRVLVNWLP
jgi:hypothetical protein